MLTICLQAIAQQTIVNCDAPVQSRKRGLGVDSLSEADFRALAPGISWYYNWGATPLSKPSDVNMEFLPMAWNGSSGFQTSISAYLAAGNRPWRVLALNEPNFNTQANMIPSDAANTFKQVKAICDPYNIPVVGPHMAIGTAANQSVTAYDPLQGSNVTYTFQEPYLNAFQYYCGATQPSGMATHSYGGYGEITWILGTMHADYPTQKVWLTEFCPWGAADDATVLASLIPAVDYCERTSWVEGYAWFMSRISGDAHNSLLGNSGVLTVAGKAYVQMPVHDTSLFYHVPGRLQAERYAVLNQVDIAPTTDADGLADMKATAAGGTLDYNIHVDAAGNYPMNFRVAGATGQIRVYRNGSLIATATTTQTGWATVSTTVPLLAGTQTIRVTLGANAQLLNWMEFLAINGMPSVPSGLSATPAGTQMALAWSLAAGATSYNVKRSLTNGGPYTTIANTNQPSYTDSGLAMGTTYYYVVSSVNAAGESTNSSQVSATASFTVVNLALNKPVVVSSVENGGTGGTNAVDGLTGTRWSSARSDPQSIYVDMQGTYTVTQVRLNWENAYGKAYQIQVSPDATNWATIFSTNTGSGGIENLTGLSGTGRYVRMYGTTRGTGYGYSLWEFEVYGTVPAPTNLLATAGDSQVALNWPASPGATSYNLKSALASGGPYTTLANVSTPGFTNTGLANGTIYYYVVTALNSFSESTNSPQANATPANRPPVLAAIANQTILAGRTLLVTNSAADPEGQPLTYSLASSPVGSSIAPNSGIFSWRPTIAQSPSTQTVAVVVSDSGVPPQSATQSFSVFVTRPRNPTVTSAGITNGKYGFWLDGDAGPDYVIFTSTNLTTWVPVCTNLSPVMPCYWTETNAFTPARFYRVLVGP